MTGLSGIQDFNEVTIRTVTSWNVEEIADLYREGGWWLEEWQPADLAQMITGSFRFAVAVHDRTGIAVGMGRLISDGASDAYLQDLVVAGDCRNMGVGGRLVRHLLKEAKNAGIDWIGCIAEPGTVFFYREEGFRVLENYIPMKYTDG